MTKLKELKIVKDLIDIQINNLISELREQAYKKLPISDMYSACIHLNEDGVYTCSCWMTNNSLSEDCYMSYITYNDIKSGKKVTLDQDEYCQRIQIQLCVLNKIKGYQ